MKYKHEIKTTAYFILENIPFVGTVISIPNYIKAMKEAPITFVIKDKRTMGRYKAINWLEPLGKRIKVPKNTVYVREDWWENKREKITAFEKIEIFLMREIKLNYEKARRIATEVIK